MPPDGAIERRAGVAAAGTDVNQPAPDGTTALHWAAENNDDELVAMLLKAGAHVTATNRYGVQPLSLAAVNGNAAIIDALAQSRRRREQRAAGRRNAADDRRADRHSRRFRR